MRRLISLLVIAVLGVSGTASANELTVADSEEVFIVKGSTINLVSRESSIPVVVSNNSVGQMNLVVNLRATNPKVVLDETAISVSIPAGTTANVQFPVRAIGSGQVLMVAWLSTSGGIEVGEPVTFRMVVNPDIETAAIVLFLGFVSMLILIGVIRTLRRRRAL